MPIWSHFVCHITRIGSPHVQMPSTSSFGQVALQVKSGSRQGVDLKKAIDDAIVREGLIGVGVGTGLLAAGAVAIGLLLSGRRH